MKPFIIAYRETAAHPQDASLPRVHVSGNEFALEHAEDADAARRQFVDRHPTREVMKVADHDMKMGAVRDA
jgi:hypothetical protein